MNVIKSYIVYRKATNGGGEAVWGGITGDINNQADLIALINSISPVDATDSVKGISKLYSDLSSSNTDGSATQSAIKSAVDGKWTAQDWNDTTKGYVEKAVKSEAETAADATEGNRDNDRGLTARSWRWAFDAVWAWIKTQTKATPIDADGVVIIDSADSNATKITTWTNIKAFLKTYFDTLYTKASSAELNTGSNDVKFATALALQGSKYLDQSGSKLYGVASGTTTYTLTLTPAPASIPAGFKISVLFPNANAGTNTTLNVNGTGAAMIVKGQSMPVNPNDIPANELLDLTFDGSFWRMDAKRALQIPIAPIPDISGGTVQSAMVGLKAYIDTQISLNSSARATGTIGNSELLGLGTAYTIVPAPVGNIFYSPKQIAIYFDPAGTPFDTYTDVSVYLGDELIKTFSGLLAETDPFIVTTNDINLSALHTNLIEQPLAIKVEGGNPANGDGFLRYEIEYRAIQLEDFDIATLLILQESVLNGYTLPSTDVQIALDEMIKFLKTNNVWNKFDYLRLYATDGDSDFATINLVNPTGNKCLKINAPTFTPLEGFTGNGTSSYIDSNYNPASDGIKYQLNDASFGVFIKSHNGGGDISYGASAGTHNTRIQVSASSPRMACNSSGFLSATAITELEGLFAISRSSSSSFKRMYGRENLKSNISSASTIIPNRTFYELACNTGGTPSGFSTSQISAAFAGAALTETDFDNLETALENYLTDITP